MPRAAKRGRGRDGCCAAWCPAKEAGHWKLPLEVEEAAVAVARWGAPSLPSQELRWAMLRPAAALVKARAALPRRRRPPAAARPRPRPRRRPPRPQPQPEPLSRSRPRSPPPPHLWRHPSPPHPARSWRPPRLRPLRSLPPPPLRALLTPQPPVRPRPGRPPLHSGSPLPQCCLR